MSFVTILAAPVADAGQLVTALCRAGFAGVERLASLVALWSMPG